LAAQLRVFIISRAAKSSCLAGRLSSNVRWPKHPKASTNSAHRLGRTLECRATRQAVQDRSLEAQASRQVGKARTLRLPKSARFSRSDGTVGSGASAGASAGAYPAVTPELGGRPLRTGRPRAAEVPEVLTPWHRPRPVALAALPGTLPGAGRGSAQAVLSRSAGHHRCHLAPKHANRGAVPSNPSLESGHTEAGPLGPATAKRYHCLSPAQGVLPRWSAQLER
jgi:hypothetical protein